ncbi:MAG: hypothetical protein O2782_21385 [bacterium]|nr:hypothetical protein [bacterium]
MSGEDWLIVAGVTVLVIAISAVIWFGLWITGDNDRSSPDEHEALGIGAVTYDVRRAQ